MGIQVRREQRAVRGHHARDHETADERAERGQHQGPAASSGEADGAQPAGIHARKTRKDAEGREVVVRHHSGEARAQEAGRFRNSVLVRRRRGVVQLRFGRHDAGLPPECLAALDDGGCPPRGRAQVEAAAAPGEGVVGQDREAPGC